MHGLKPLAFGGMPETLYAWHQPEFIPIRRGKQSWIADVGLFALEESKPEQLG